MHQFKNRIMKKFNLTSALLIAVLAFSSCKKDKTPTFEKVTNTKEFVQTFSPKVQTQKINSSVDSRVLLKGGTILSFEANSFTINGEPITGEVTVEVYEMLNRSSVIFSGTNTNHISGRPLISQGFIFVDVKSNGQSVDRNLSKRFNISIPAEDNTFTMIWAGIIENDQLAWIDVEGPNGDRNGIKPDVSNNFVFDFGNLGWVNCDVFFNDSAPKTTVSVSITNNPGEFATYWGYTGDTFVYFCAKGDNVVAQLYNTDGPNTVKSYDNSMPIGSEGKIISFSIKEGKFYYAEKEVTITANLSESLTLTETTQIAIQNAINSLNSY
jgi:hypothetical protein